MFAKYKDSILIIILFLFLFIFVINKTYPDLVEIMNIETNLHTSTAQMKELTSKLEGLKQSELQKQSMLARSPKKILKIDSENSDMEASFTTMFDDIIDMAKYDGIRIFAVQYNYNPPDDVFVKGSNGKYNVCNIDMQIVSDYADLSAFLKDLYKYPYMINIDRLQLAGYPKNKRLLLTTLSIKIYTETNK